MDKNIMKKGKSSHRSMLCEVNRNRNDTNIVAVVYIMVSACMSHVHYKKMIVKYIRDDLNYIDMISM